MQNFPVLITGASSGIGKACALFLSKNGFHVFAGVRKSTDGDALQRDAMGKITPIMVDVADMPSIDACVKELASQTGGRLYGLINNAGVAFAGPLELFSLKEMQNLLNVNVMGTLAMTKACLPLLRNNKGARLINIGSISGLFALPGFSCYAASKHAVEAITDSLRLELKPFDIHVSVIEPGNVETPIFDKALSVSSEMKNAAGKEVQGRYTPLIGLMDKILHNPQGMPVDKVSTTVFEALTTRKPKTRYLMGKDAKMLKLIGRFPDRLRDVITVWGVQRMFA